MFDLLKRLSLLIASPASHARVPSRQPRFECLLRRDLMAIDLDLTEPVAQFAKAGSFVGYGSEAGRKVGALLSTLDQSSLTNVRQSEVLDGVLYSVGSDISRASYVATNPTTGVSQKVILPDLFGGSTDGNVEDLAKVNGKTTLVGASKFNVGGTVSATTWGLNGIPSLVTQPSVIGSGTLGGRAAAINGHGLIVGNMQNVGAYVLTSRGFFALHLDQIATTSNAHSITDSARFISGTIGFESVLWEAIGDPIDGNFVLRGEVQKLPSDAQGALPMNVLDSVQYGGLGLGGYVDADGDNHAAIWSLPNGVLLADFGANSSIKDVKTINGLTFVAYVDEIGSHILNFDTGKNYDLANLLSNSTADIQITNGGLFETNINGMQVIGVSYAENGALKASMFELVAAAYDLSGDVSATGVTLPFSTDFVFTEVGGTNVNVTVTDELGSETQLNKPVVVRSSGVVASNGTTSLLLGGSDSLNDSYTVEKIANGYRITVAGESKDYIGAMDQVLANLGSGSDTLRIFGAQSFDLSKVTNVERIELDSQASVTLRNVTKAAVFNAAGAAGGLVIKMNPDDVLGHNNEWKYAGRTTLNGVEVHWLKADEVNLYIENQRYQNPILREDVEGSGTVTPLDALLGINYLNRQANGGQNSVSSAQLDVNGDGLISPVDVLLVINYLNRSRGSAEGEGLQVDSSCHDLEHDANAILDALQSSGWFDEILEGAKAKLSRTRLA